MRFPLFQFVVVVAVILLLQAADDNSVLGQIYYSLDKLVDYTMRSLSAVFNVKSFTKSWLTTGFWIAYVYLACLLTLSLLRFAIRVAVDLVGRSNAFWLRNAIARERGIVAYRAWVPFERIRPPHIPQEEWEQRFAWPANNKPPYLPLAQRMVRGVIGYVVVTLTEQAAAEFAKLAQRLRERGHPSETVAHFINRLVFCMFAEDVDLLPNKMFKRMLEHTLSRPDEFEMMASDLFRAMKAGGRIGFEHVAWFNGGLFNDDAALPLDKDDIDLTLRAAGLDWAEIDPSILGPLKLRGAING